MPAIVSMTSIPQVGYASFETRLFMKNNAILKLNVAWLAKNPCKTCFYQPSGINGFR
jgi:hypothetical protein